MLTFDFAILFFILGMAVFFNKSLSYIFAVLGAISCTFVGFEGYINGFSYQINVFNGLSLSIGVDKLSAVFLIIAYVCFSAIALYSIDFGKLFSKTMSFLINLTMLSMLFIFCAKDAITFLVAFEITNISLFFLILEKSNSYKQAYKFLAFSEGSSVLLMIAFAIIFAHSGTFLFQAYQNNYLFALFAFLGFIIKMDIVPTHVWIGQTYSKAPSNIAAILSVPLTLVGTYGVFRVFSLEKSVFLAIIAVILGALSAFWGALQSARETQLKTLPAYSTVENNGMILASLGVSMLARYSNLNILADFSYLTAIFLIISHSLSKTTMFLSIGHAKETLQKENIDDLGGILKNVSKSAGFGMLISGLSFSAVPPLIGFVSEWMLLESLFQSYKFQDNFFKLIVTFAGILIALAIGLSSFGIKKLVGFSSLGKSIQTIKKIPDFTIKLAENLMSALVILSGIFSFLIVFYLGYNNFLDGILGVPKPALMVSSRPIFGVVSPFMFAIVFGFLLFFTLLLKFSNKKIKTVTPWVGGLKLKENEMYNTRGYSFIVEYVLRGIYRTKEKDTYVESYDVSNLIYQGLEILFKKLSCFLSKYIMNGNLNYYIAYIIAMFIIALFVFKL
ncbi:proton-conducting transporter membrane subunit [Desulfurella multipotens]|nr:proton-conducting transporter membrane subunit [Desulfurella multipotens]PMP69301.1 MAG: NADH/ubiquinone/plastoquinone (complex I) [Desulfurella multipotens]